MDLSVSPSSIQPTTDVSYSPNRRSAYPDPQTRLLNLKAGRLGIEANKYKGVKLEIQARALTYEDLF